MKKSLIILPVLFVSVPDIEAVAALRIDNNSARVYNAKMNMQNNLYAAPTTAQILETVPVNQQMVAAPNVVADNISTDTDLDMCSMIYPTGSFAIDKPTAGLSAAGPRQCVAVVELRGYQMGENGSDLVLARANVATGDGIKCNIDYFPEYSITAVAENVIFPADKEPTIEDVTKVMDQEQKQNAGLKIAAAALVGGIGGNIAGKNDVGKNGLIGTDKGKITGTAIGALSGAALMAGSTYSGKVAGDIILSTGVNMAAGGVIGNMAASGDSVMRIENCKIDGRSAKCLWGAYIETEQTDQNKKYYYDIKNSRGLECTSDNSACQIVNLTQVKLTNMDKYLDTNIKDREKQVTYLSDMNADELEKFAVASPAYCQQVNGSVATQCDFDAAMYYLVESAAIPNGAAKAVMVEMLNTLPNKPFGWKKSDWSDLRGRLSGPIYLRNNMGDSTGATDYDMNFFNPIYQDASDGGIVDLGNKARLKSTLIGAGAGGALGGFVAYQGAQSDINERWVAAVREYKDSLQKIYCATGTRFLSYYNDTFVIPKPQGQE
ncbi:MAG: hypothetical protein KBS86_00830 [Proteobacteria bacterium]|nr:hypothetical protein [Candidatus Enterousia scatequi]